MVGLASQMDLESREAFAQVNGRLDEVNDGFARVDGRFTKVDERLARVDERFDKVDERFDKLESDMRAEFAAIRRHAEVMAESIRDDIRMLAEGYANISEKLDSRRR
jgi:predicted nuclease with TOPRIM domain